MDLGRSACSHEHWVAVSDFVESVVAGAVTDDAVTVAAQVVDDVTVDAVAALAYALELDCTSNASVR